MEEVKSFYDLVGDGFSVKIRALKRGEKYIGCYSLHIGGSNYSTNPDYENRKKCNTIQQAVEDARDNAKSTIRMHMKLSQVRPDLADYAGKAPVVNHPAVAENKQVELF